MKTLFLAFVLLFALDDVHSAVRIASPTGSGTACTLGSPCSLNTAIFSAALGDTIQMRTGTYGGTSDASTAWPTTSAGLILTIENYNGESVTIAANGAAAINNGRTTASHVTFRGINVSCTGAFAECIGLQGNNFRFENVTATGNNSSTSTAGNVVLINAAAHHNTFTGGRYHNPGADTQGGFFSGDGYPFYIQGDDNIVEHAEIDNGRAYGVHIYGPSPDRNIVRFNKIHNVCQTLGTCAGILLGSGSGNTAHNNVIYGVTGTGTGAIAGIQISNGATNSKAENNTISGSKWSCFHWDNTSSGGSVRNNICSGHARDFWNGTAQNTSNLTPLSSYSTNRCDFALATICSTTATPGFTNVGANDYTLAIGSPLENAGANVGLPCNGGCAIGAFDPPVLIGIVAGTAGANKITLTFDADAGPPLRATSFATGWSALKNAVNNPITSAVLIGNAVIELTTQNNFLSTDTCSVAYDMRGASLTDSVAIGGTLHQPFLSRSSVPCNLNIPTGGATVLTQLSYRVRELYGSETAAGWKTTGENTPYDVVTNGATRVRIKATSSVAAPAAFNLGFQKRITLPGGSAGAKTTLTDTCSPTELACFFGTGTALGVANNTPTTEQLTSTLANANCLTLLQNSTPNIQPGINTEWECEIAVKLDPALPKGSKVEIFMTRDGGAEFESYPTNSIATLNVIDNSYTEGASLSPADVNIQIGSTWAYSLTNRANDKSDVVHIEVPRTARVRINGVVIP